MDFRRSGSCPRFHRREYPACFFALFRIENLLSSEQLGLDGANSEHGFNEGIIYGDRGYLPRDELSAPVIPVEKLLLISPSYNTILLDRAFTKRGCFQMQIREKLFSHN